MYFRPNLNIYDSMICARSQVYNKAYTLSVNGQKIRKVDKVKFLGVFIDDQLSWDYQIEHIENKLLSTIVLIKQEKHKEKHKILLTFQYHRGGINQSS